MTYFLLSLMLIVGVNVNVGMHADVAEDVEGEKNFETDIFMI